MTKQMYDDDDLERIVRAGLAHHAQDAPAELASWARARAPGPARAHRRGRWMLPAAAAAVTLAVPIGYQLARDSGQIPSTGSIAAGSRSSTITPTTPSAATRKTQPRLGTGARPNGIPANWRAESFGGVQLWVPPTWGWGGAPFRADWNGDQPLDCSGGRAFTIPGSSDYEVVPDTPYVGRPVMMTDACGGSPEARPNVDAVWFDAAGIKPGTQTYADGVVRETRQLGAITVSVFSADSALREQILGSAQQVDIDANGCPTTPPDPIADSTWGNDAVPSALAVCVYSQSGAGLLWSGQVGEKEASTYAAAAGLQAPGAHAGAPTDWVGEEKVYLGLISLGAGDDHRVRWDRYSPNVIESPDGNEVVLTPASVANTAPWAKNSGGVKAYVVGGVDLDPALQKFFRGILG